jgi:major membrane immunogen (membrane-anchored lipoprotein)
VRLALIAAVAATAVLVGCGDSDKPKILDTERVERAIERSVLQKRKIRAMVSCPSGIELKKGKKFRCIANYTGGRTPFLVTQTDDEGAVRYVGLRAGS